MPHGPEWAYLAEIYSTAQPSISYHDWANRDLKFARRNSSSSLVAAAPGPGTGDETVASADIQPLLDEALARWQAAGADTTGLGTIQISNLPGLTLGMASGHTIWLDHDAAGWGWFADPTPWEDSEFTTPGDHGEMDRMDLLSVIAHELGHILGYEHEADSVMAETLAAGERTLDASPYLAYDLYFASLDED